MNRRENLKTLSLGVGAILSNPVGIAAMIPDNTNKSVQSKIRHSVSRWCYASTPLEKLVDFCKEKNIHSIELLEPDEYKYVTKKGLTCAVANGPETHITRGFNEPALHTYLLNEYRRLIPMAADAGIPNIICFSGNRNRLDDKTGLENCVQGLEPVVKLAEKYKITLIMELLNSKVDHSDYQCDHTSWGVGLVEKMASPHFKLLYDIYHMQIMEGNIIDTLRKNISSVAHIHTAGVPGRNDLDQYQELNYPAIFRTLKEIGYSGFIGQEFIPKKQNPLESLWDSVQMVEQA